jgi:hypothetical protein
MADKEIILTFNWDGTVEKEVKGFEGKKCVEATRFIEEALGAKNKKIRYNPEYTRQETKNENRLRY